jgi:hypothetical protein
MVTMERVFLSYSYHPHPEHAADLERLRRYVIRAIEALDLRVVDGVDVGGRSLDAALRARIEDADALIALVTPQIDGLGGPREPRFVLDEFQCAEALKKPTMRVCHNLLVMTGLGVGNEYTPYIPGREVDVILKLMNTVAVWKRDYGRRARLCIEPESLAASYDPTQGDECWVQVILPNGKFRDFERVPLGFAPGAAFALLPMLREGDVVRLRLRQGGSMWQSPRVIDPFVGSVTLKRQL